MLEPLRSSPAFPLIAPLYNERQEDIEYAAITPKLDAVNHQSAANSVFNRFLDRPLERTLDVKINYPDARGAPQTLTQEVDFIPSAASEARNRLLASVDFIGASLDGDLETIRKILPSIVRVSAESKDDKSWYGSGVIVEPTDILPGYIPSFGEYFVLTNNHIAEGAEYITVKLNNGVEYQAKIVGSRYGTALMDKEMDVALLRVVIPYAVPTARIGSPKELLHGQPIYTAGHPQALPNVAITKGIISSPQQETGSLSLDIQSDAPINPGNSGGPSFNRAGEVVGLNTYTFKNSENLTFTKPIDQQLAALRQLWDKGWIFRGALNFEVQAFPLIDRIQAGFPEGLTGAIVTSVAAGSSLDKAGLKTGDIVSWIEVDKDGAGLEPLQVDIKDAYEADGIIKRWAANLMPGTPVRIVAYRKEGKGYSTIEINTYTEMLL